MRKFILTLLFFPITAAAAPSAVVYDISNSQVINGSLDASAVSIASISKLMTVYTVLKHNQKLDEKLTVIGNRTPNTKLVKGMKLTRLDLVNLSLVSSDNLAAQTLSENFPGGRSGFMKEMNNNARKLNMSHSGFVDPTGLSIMNFSTLLDIITLTKAVSEFDIVKKAAQVHSVTADTTTGKKTLKVKGMSTSSFFGKEGIVTIKTGFTNAAGFCITMLVWSKDKLYNITVLGAKSKNERQAIVDRLLASINPT
jgi:D-alanyl-D-alanine endopeptidase (penicillin-binding protein 7)